MSTRGVIAVERDGERVGRYLHYGHPDDARDALAFILTRDGFDAAARVLVDDHAGWSSIDPAQTLGAGTARLTPVAGYGLAYVDEPHDEPQPPSAYDHEHVYVLTAHGLVVEAAGKSTDGGKGEQ